MQVKTIILKHVQARMASLCPVLLKNKPALINGILCNTAVKARVLAESYFDQEQIAMCIVTP